MRDNYKYASVDYDGKTISKTVTMILTRPEPTIVQMATSSTPTVTATTAPIVSAGTTTTTAATTTPTTAVSTVATAATTATTETTAALQNVGIPTTTATPIPTATVNYSATITALERNISEQNAKIEEQNDLIDQILRFLGLK